MCAPERRTSQLMCVERRHESRVEPFTIARPYTYRMLNNRIGIFINLPMASLDRLSLQKRLDEIGKAQSAPASTAS